MRKREKLINYLRSIISELSGITKEESEEVEKIKSYLDPDEQVLLVAKQGRIAPGGSITTPSARDDAWVEGKHSSNTL
jgi:hypothetical protein